MIIVLFNPLLAVDVETDGVPGDGSETNSKQETSPIDTPQQIVSHASICIETVIHLFYRRHGFESFFTFLIVATGQLGFSATTRIKEPNLNKNLYEALRATIMIRAKYFRDQQSNYYLAEVMLSVYRDSMKAEERSLLTQLIGVNDDEERKALVAQHTHSAWPVKIIKTSQSPENIRVDSLIRAYIALNMDS